MQGVIANPRPDYRFNIPSQVAFVLMAGSICAVAGIYLLYNRWFLFGTLLVIVAGLVGLFRLMLFLITDPKRREIARDRMLNSIRWTGAEQVLDVGCGNGMVLLAAAKHLAVGKGIATGIDIWNEMAGRQSAGALRRNAELEGVLDRIELREADARKMPFEKEAFDIIFASLSLHHAGGKDGIQQVVAEMKRVLKPNGVILLYDLFPATAIASRVLRELGAKDVRSLGGGVLRVLRAE